MEDLQFYAQTKLGEVKATFPRISTDNKRVVKIEKLVKTEDGIDFENVGTFTQHGKMIDNFIYQVVVDWCEQKHAELISVDE